MSHVRTQLRTATAALLAGLPTTGARVFQSYVPPRNAADLPCILLTTGSEDIEAGTVSGSQDRRLNITVRGLAMANSSLDATLDAIALEVETALSAGTYQLKSIDTDFDDSLEKPVGSISLIFEILYFTHAGNPGVTI